MSNVSRSEFNAALKRLLGLRGGVALRLDETIVPVVVIGNLDRDFARINLPFFEDAATGSVAGERAYAIIRNPISSNYVVVVEYLSVESNSPYVTGVRGLVGDGGAAAIPQLGSTVTLGGQSRDLLVPGQTFGSVTVEWGNDPAGTWSQFSHKAAGANNNVEHVRTQYVLYPGHWMGVRSSADNNYVAVSLAGVAWPEA